MSEAVLSTISLGDLLDLDRETLWIKGLAKCYGVNDVAIALAYCRRAEVLDLSFGEEIVGMLNLLPVSAVIANPTPKVLSNEALLDALEPVMDAGSMARVSHVLNTPANASVEPQEFLFETWGGIQELKTLGRQYMLTEKPQTQPESLTATFLDRQHLIVAHAKGAGLFVGNDVHYYGKTTKDGLQKLPPGWVFFGPKIDLDPGSYVAEIDISCENPDAELIFEVAANAGLSKLVELKTIGDVRVRLMFEVGERHNAIEIRCVNPSRKDVLCDIRRVILGRRWQ
ncbi:hypothetical protein ACQKGC_26205 [Allorhizobium pseudoryzae]|uniref:hypothetical protein n=1 Tax=Allorhizobium pseudoryzae TaxID=379684 RepID=UPI003CFD6DBE